jgi:REP element-mobilizing transposase RayT
MSPEERDVVMGALPFYDGKRYALVVMNDHVHTVLRPLEGNALERILQGIKSYCAHKINRLHGRTGAFWQQEGYDRIIRDAMEWEGKVNYTLDNPFRRWPDLQEYKWHWCPGMEERY